MKRNVLYLCAFALALISFSCKENVGKNQIVVMQFNLWQEGTIIEGGFDGIVDEIIAADADFVALSEVRNYEGARFCDKLIHALKQRGQTYYSFLSYDTGLLSRTPITDSTEVFPWSSKTDAGSVHRLVTTVFDKEIAFYTAHLDYRNCAYYDVRGYGGSSWNEIEPLTDVDMIIDINQASKRDDAVKRFIEVAKNDIAANRIVIMGGDYNEPSHLDWTVATKDMRDHHGLVVPWDVSMLLEEAGYKDSYREIYPNPVTHPGFTYPANAQGAEVSKLTWAPKADERERIDYIHYYPSESLELVSATVVAPKGDIYRAKRDTTPTADPLRLPVGVWPTDHKALVVTFCVK